MESTAPLEPARVRPSTWVEEHVGPGECVGFGEWKVLEEVALYSTPGDTTVELIRAPAGETVTTMDGMMRVNRTGVLVAERAMTLEFRGNPVEVMEGDTVTVLHYGTEGFWNVWYQGSAGYVDGTGWRDTAVARSARFSARMVQQPEASYWIRASYGGQEGWILAEPGHGLLDPPDGCG